MVIKQERQAKLVQKQQKFAKAKLAAEFKEKRIERLRKLVERGSVVPNLKAKMWGARLLEEIEGEVELVLNFRT